jgi:hypothetical protein
VALKWTLNNFQGVFVSLHSGDEVSLQQINAGCRKFMLEQFLHTM